MNLSELKTHLSKSELAPLYLVWVEDAFSFDQAMILLREALTKKHPGFEEIHWNSEKPLNALLEELGSFSFFSKHKLIRIDGDDFCKEEEASKLSDALQGAALATLVIVPKKKTALNSALKALKNLAQTVECVKPKGKDLTSYVVSFASEEGKKMGSAASLKLVDLIGEDLLALQNQVKLLAVFAKDKPEISLEDVQALFADSAEKDVFQLTQHILQNDKAKTFALLRQLLDQGEVPLIIFSLLIRHYRMLMKLKLLEKRKMNAYEMASIVRLPAFVIEKSMPQARQLPWKKLIQVYKDLSQTDLQLKSSPLPHLAILEKFLWGCFSN